MLANPSSVLEEILTPEEFCKRLLPKFNESGLRKNLSWLWPRLTKPLRKEYLQYCKQHLGEAGVERLGRLIKEQEMLPREELKPRPGFVVEAFFPYADPPDFSRRLDEQVEKLIELHKTRPALIVRQFSFGSLTYYLLVKISDANHSDKSADFDVCIKHYKYCGLRKPSDLRIHTLVSIDSNGIIGVYGELSEEDRAKVRELWHKHILPEF